MEPVLDLLATYRLTRLVTQDHLTEPLRQRVFSRFGYPDESKLSYLISCPWCLSIYVGAGVALARMIVPKTWAPVSLALAASAASGLITER